MREVKINRNLKLREDGKLFNVRTGKEFKPKSRSVKGYILVRCKDYNNSMVPVHLLVMKFFGPPKPGPEYQIDHHNQNKLDNDINNLRWVTPSENCFNKSNNCPVGHRKCDFDNINEYNNDRSRRYNKRHKKS